MYTGATARDYEHTLMRIKPDQTFDFSGMFSQDEARFVKYDSNSDVSDTTTDAQTHAQKYTTGVATRFTNTISKSITHVRPHMRRCGRANASNRNPRPPPARSVNRLHRVCGVGLIRVIRNARAPAFVSTYFGRVMPTHITHTHTIYD